MYTGATHYSTSFGKYCFPVDQEEAAKLCSGLADIEIVADKGSYSLFRAIMCKYELPDNDEIVKFLLDNFKKFGGGHLMIRRGSKKGDYMVFQSPNSCIDGVCYRQGSSIALYEKDCLDEKDGATEVISMSVNDFITKKFGNKTVKEYMEGIEKFNFDTSSSIASDKFINDLFDDAINFGFVDLRTIYNTDFVVIYEDEIAEATAYFTQNEIESVLTMASEINQKANETVLGKIEKGKISLLR